jgi:hypothetical protein
MKTLKECINESLISHDAKKLAAKIAGAFSKQFGQLWAYVNWPLDDNTGTVKLYLNNIGLKLLDDNSYMTGKLADNEISKKFYKMLNFFNYHITSIEEGDPDASEENNSDWPCINIEPRYSKNVTKKFIKGNRKNNIFYHVTRRENVENILKKGLKCKEGKSAAEGGYRYFPDKIFLIAESKFLRDDIDVITEAFGLYGDDFAIIKVNFGKRKFDLYKDDASYFGRPASDTFVYTYENIPPQMLSLVEYDELPE